MLEGTLQTLWDRHLSRAPILLIVVGSDVSMMAALGGYDRPLCQPMQELVVEPFNVDAPFGEVLGPAVWPPQPPDPVSS